MEYPPTVFLYLLLLLFQTLHIFEEIGLEAYQAAGSLTKYLKVAAAIVTISYLPVLLILVGLRGGYILAVFGALLAVGNGIIHLVGVIKTRSVRGTIGAGVFTGIPLALTGVLVLSQLAKILLG
jgi:hypothetical protein